MYGSNIFCVQALLILYTCNVLPHNCIGHEKKSGRKRPRPKDSHMPPAPDAPGTIPPEEDGMFLCRNNQYSKGIGSHFIGQVLTSWLFQYCRKLFFINFLRRLRGL